MPHQFWLLKHLARVDMVRFWPKHDFQTKNIVYIFEKNYSFMKNIEMNDVSCTLFYKVRKREFKI